MKKIILLTILTLGLLSAEGINTVDENKSKKSCDSVEVKGCFDSNFMTKLLTRVCNNGKVEACYNLGLLYAKGEGITQNKPKAIKLFKKACEGGIKEACDDYNALTTCEE